MVIIRLWTTLKTCLKLDIKRTLVDTAMMSLHLACILPVYVTWWRIKSSLLVKDFTIRFKRIYFIKKSVWLKVWMIHTIPPFITDIDDSYRKSWSSGTSRDCFIICISIFGISFAVRISNILTQNYIVWSQRFDTF